MCNKKPSLREYLQVFTQKLWSICTFSKNAFTNPYQIESRENPVHVERAFAFCNLREKEDMKDTGTVIIIWQLIHSEMMNLFLQNELLRFYKTSAVKEQAQKSAQMKTNRKSMWLIPDMEVTKTILAKISRFCQL